MCVKSFPRWLSDGNKSIWNSERSILVGQSPTWVKYVKSCTDVLQITMAVPILLERSSWDLCPNSRFSIIIPTKTPRIQVFGHIIKLCINIHKSMNMWSLSYSYVYEKNTEVMWSLSHYFPPPTEKNVTENNHRKTKQSKQSKQTLGIQSPCQMMIGVYNHLQNAKVFRFHETILSFGEPGSLKKMIQSKQMILPPTIILPLQMIQSKQNFHQRMCRQSWCLPKRIQDRGFFEQSDFCWEADLGKNGFWICFFSLNLNFMYYWTRHL